MDRLLGVFAFVDVAIVIAVPVLVIVLGRRRRLWKAYALVIFPYLVYCLFAGRLPYLSAYVLVFACLPIWFLSLHTLQCREPWQTWAAAVFILGVLPTALLLWGSMSRRQLRNDTQRQR